MNNNPRNYGMCSEDSSILKKYSSEELNNLRYIKYNLKKQIVCSDNNVITTIYVHPVDRLCYGSCTYCYNKSYEYDKNFGYLQPKRYDEFLNFIQDKLADVVTVNFSGGSCFLYKDLYSLVNISKKYIKNLNIGLYTDMMYDEKTYKKALKVFNKLIYDSNVETVSVYINTDYGSNTRYSKYLGITTECIHKRAKEIVEKYGKYEKFHIDIKINVNKETDKDILLYNIDNMKDKNCFLVITPVRDLKYSPSVEQLKDVIYTIKNYFDTKVMYWRELVIGNSLNIERIKGSKTFYNSSYYHLFIKNKKGDYIYSPYYFDCPGYISSVGIASKSYLPCFIGYLEEDNVEDSLVYSHSEEEDHYKKFLTLSDECRNCSILPVCMRCMVRRHLLPCSKIPSLKWWEEFIWNKKCEETDFHVYI